ncbi:hypothetical protein BDY24DRAFT_399288 [Mrakia frigida]|uniref:uncharacterized protein n=1 Tax=Mrakia frigida TaxID=29902 RepID=UPI003FCC18CF
MMSAPRTTAFDAPSSPTAFQFSASTFASLGYSEGFIQGMFRDQSSASSPSSTPPKHQPSQLVTRPQRPRRVSSVSVNSSPTKPSIPHSFSYSIPPLADDQLQIDEIEKAQQKGSSSSIGGFLTSKIKRGAGDKKGVEGKEIRMMGGNEAAPGSLLDPLLKSKFTGGTIGRSSRSRRSLPLQPALPPPTSSLPPLPTYVPSRSLSPNLQPQPTLGERRRQRSRTPPEVDDAAVSKDERTRDRERALRALEGRR